MNGDDTRLDQTLAFGAAALIARLLPVGLLLIFIGLALFILDDADHRPHNQIGVILCLGFGAPLTVFALWRRRDAGRPLFSLTPAGVQYRIAGVKEFLIPWSEVKGVDTINIQTDLPWYIWFFTPLHSYNSIYCSDVTILLVSKKFYDETIFVSSFFMRGPGWTYNFIPKGDDVQVALHHELVSVEAKTLRVAVEARWRAFRDAPRIASAEVVALGNDEPAPSRWRTAQIVLLLIGIAVALANIAGLWRLPGQDEARLARIKAREQGDYWKRALRQSEQESREREAQAKKREKEFDEMMKQTFGD